MKLNVVSKYWSGQPKERRGDGYLYLPAYNYNHWGVRPLDLSDQGGDGIDSSTQVLAVRCAWALVTMSYRDRH
jgi:hypothetical protein